MRNWGIAAPPDTTLGASAGGVLEGELSWRVTWENQNVGTYGLYGNILTATMTADQQVINRPSITVPVVDP